MPEVTADLEVAKIAKAVSQSAIPDATPTPDSEEEKKNAGNLDQEAVLDRRADRAGRVQLLPQLMEIVVLWSGATLAILGCQGLSEKYQFFKLSDAVLIALLTTAMANILGMLAIATNYLFNEKRIGDKKP